MILSIGKVAITIYSVLIKHIKRTLEVDVVSILQGSSSVGPSYVRSCDRWDRNRDVKLDINI